jgi:hypothetical protein
MKIMTRIFSTLVLGAIGCSVLQPAKSLADTITWRVQNKYAEQVQLEFYSQTRRYAWPGNGKAYSLFDRRVYRISIECNRGEHICYGAWVNKNASRYWGVGLKNRYRCSDCCFDCENNVILLPILE